ncbi:MAG: DUF2958 domain-containing protein [Candidatus Binataceae bacterium]|nr:DUF2958 domain-containing protein [Candidatus Binataceae bacterium]
MKLLTAELREKLIKAAAAREAGDTTPQRPIVKFFCPWNACTWLISEITEEDEGDAMMFGLCDLGQGFPELGYVTLGEMQSVRGPGGLTIERDRHWSADKTLVEYADEARAAGRIKA